VAPLPAPVVPPGFLPRTATTAVPRAALQCLWRRHARPRLCHLPSQTVHHPVHGWPHRLATSGALSSPRWRVPLHRPSSAPFRGRSGRGGACHALENPRRMITHGKTGFRVVPDRLVLTVVTSSSTPSPIPSFAHAVLVDPHWRASMEEEYGALISNGT
jgi:hypothetical protein